MNAFLRQFSRELTSHVWLFIFLVALQIQPNIRLFLIRWNVYPGELIFSTVSVLFWSALATLIVALLSYWMSRTGYSSRAKRQVINSLITIILTVFTSLTVFDNYLLSAYRSVYTDSIAISILATNPDEANEFISSIPMKFILIPTFVWVAALLGLWYKRRALAHQANRLIGTRTWIAYGILLPIPLAFVSSIPMQYKLYQDGVPSFAFMTPIDRVMQGTGICIKQADEIASWTSRLDEADYGSLKKTKSLGAHNVVLIMGESLRRDYMHSYGYPIKNTPLLDSLIASDQIIQFSDVVAPAPYTVASIVENMTFHKLEDTNKQWYEYPTMMNTLSRAGYYTYWLSNQEKQGGYIQSIASLAETADSVKYVKLRTSTDWSASYDEEVIPHLLHLRDSVKYPERSQSLFQLVHIMGSHTAFAQRYPEHYNLYKVEDLPDTTPEGLERPKGGVKDENLRQYLNTIIYNDYVISEIIKSVQSEPAIVVYVSDHGVEVHDNPDNPDHSGHPSSSRGLRIPMMVYFSPQMRELQPELWEEIRKRKDDRIMTDLLTQSVCGLLGVETKYHDPKLNFFGAEYDQTRRRVVKAFDTTVEI